MTQSFAIAVVADETSQSGNIFFRSVDFEIKVGFDLESFAKVGIHGSQGSIQVRVAEHKNRSVGWHRFRTKPLGREKSKKRNRCLSTQLALFDEALPRLPR